MKLSARAGTSSRPLFVVWACPTIPLVAAPTWAYDPGMKKRAPSKSGMTLVAKNVRPDAKRRVTLGKALEDLPGISGFDIYRDELGRLVLDPQVSVPASEAWLFRNAKAIASVKRGLRDAAAGKVRSVGSFASFAGDDDAES